MYSAAVTGAAETLSQGAISQKAKAQSLETNRNGLDIRPVNLPQARKQRIRFPTKNS